VYEEHDASASVALLLKLEGDSLQILFVRRIQDARDPWSGQMALPGGRRDAEDRDLKETVVRETLEETNINLIEHCRLLGVMSTFQSMSRPEINVLPFVFLVEDELSIRLNERELEAYFWIPVEELARNRATVKFSFGEFPAYVVGSVVIWGFTYRIVESFLQTRN
jgi:8-oxo-dGTP diphosphatase